MARAKTRLLYSFLAVMLGSLVAIHPAHGTNSSVRVEFSDDRLAVDADNVDLRTLLTRISEQTDVQFVFGEEEAKQTVSLSFRGLTLEKGISRILRTSNHAMVFSPEGDLEQVIIKGQGGGRASFAANEMPVGSARTRKGARYSSSRTQGTSSSASDSDATSLSAPPKVIDRPPDGTKESASFTPGETRVTANLTEMVVKTQGNAEMVITPASSPMIVEPWRGDTMKITGPSQQGSP
jgi:hypothetical protein